MKAEKAFKVFFHKFFLPVSCFVTEYVREEEAADDIAQESFLRLYEKWNEFEGEENAKAFIYKVARNLALDWLKHKRAEANYVHAFLDNNKAEEETFLKEVMRQETFRILYAVIDQLPSQTRQVILYTLEGNSLNETGEKMGISVNTVKTLKRNGYASLRRLLPKEFLFFLLVWFGECGA